MMASIQTPPRPGPGLYPQTPAIRNGPPAPNFGVSRAGYLPQPSSSQALTTRTVEPPVPINTRPTETLKPAERAARAINHALLQVTQYPELDTYLPPGISTEYDLKSTPTWAPFQKVRMYNIPDQIFEQYNRAQVATRMGLFAELKCAWVSIDNALYIWDYTQNSPDLIGFEDQPYTITSVKLARPRDGVFLPNIKHMIVLSTTEQIMLLGLEVNPNPGLGAPLTLFQTGMTASVKGQEVTEIACSPKNGRVFFGGRTSNEVYELKYQAQDSWFASRCTTIALTRSAIQSFTGALNVFGTVSTEYVEQIVVDDSRDLVYTLSSTSAIRVFHMPSNDGALELKITKEAKDIYSNVGHIISQTDTLNPKVKIVSISPVPKAEAVRYYLVATTETGYRIYFSATTYGYGSMNFTYAPQSMQAQHVRTPPLLPATPSDAVPGPHSSNKYLTVTRLAQRFPPGFFFCFTTRDANAPTDRLFVSAPDAARLAQPSEVGQTVKSTEPSCWIDLNSHAEDIGLSVPYSPPIAEPKGFGSDISVQFDKPVPEVAILTNTGIHILKRRRLVDSFAALIRQGGGPEGFENEVNNLIRAYGREEILATALAVACGQGMEVSQDRAIRVNDPEVLEVARKVFIDYGGKPTIDQNKAVDRTLPPIDAVRPSQRHDAIARYISRIMRSTWKHTITAEQRSPTGYSILPAVPLQKLRQIQEDLTSLQRFFTINKSFIRGLSGPDDLNRTASKDDEIALQGEHRALHSLVKFVSETIEGISFILVLFEESVADIVPLLPEVSRPIFLKMTFEELFCTQTGFDLAKELVKAIVNRNIAKGSNVETIAEALRRRCGSFCSADDVIIFKAQEQLKRAGEAQNNTEYSRNLLNESLKLFEQVAHSLPQDYLNTAVNEYVKLHFFAGAITLILKVAQEIDKTNDALSWMVDGKPEPDSRRDKYEKRNQCYDLVHNILIALDDSFKDKSVFVDGRPTLAATRRDEAYDVIRRSKDEVFLTNLYDWYLSQGWYQRLLDTESAFIVTYLQRKSAEDIMHADLLWKYYGQNGQYHEAAKVQLQLAKSDFQLPLANRLEYLSQAKSNALALSTGNVVNRKMKQKLLAEINELLDNASIQDEILARLRDDPRVTDNNRSEVLGILDGRVLDITTLYNNYADNAGYYDICLLIYLAADHRDASQIKQTWQQLLQSTHDSAENMPDGPAPYEKVAEIVRELGGKLKMSENVFPIPMLVEILERYSIAQQQSGQQTAEHWVIDTFIDLEVPYEALYDSLEVLFFTQDPQFTGRAKRVLLSELLYVVERWFQQSLRSGTAAFGGDEGFARVEELLTWVTERGPRMFGGNARDRGQSTDNGEAEWRVARELRQRMADMLT